MNTIKKFQWYFIALSSTYFMYHLFLALINSNI